MTDDLRWLEDDDDRNDPSPGDLRNLVKKLQKELKDRDEKLAAQGKTIDDLTGQVKATSLRDLLTAQNIDPKFAKVAERDGVEPTEDAVKQWRQDYDGIYAFRPAAEQSLEDDAGDEGEGDEGHVPDGLDDALQAGQNLEGAGHPSGSSTISDALRAARANPGQFKTEEELDAYLRKLGAPSLASLGAPNDTE